MAEQIVAPVAETRGGQYPYKFDGAKGTGGTGHLVNDGSTVTPRDEPIPLPASVCPEAIPSSQRLGVRRAVSIVCKLSIVFFLFTSIRAE